MSAEQSKRVARVLSISGDGVRTAVAAHVLAELEHRTGQPVHKLFHLIVGEGSGAVLAMLMALRSVGGRVLPLGAEAAAITIEEGLPAFRAPRTWWTQMRDRVWGESMDQRAQDDLQLGAICLRVERFKYFGDIADSYFLFERIVEVLLVDFAV